MDDERYRHEPVRAGADGTGANPGPDLLTVSQAYDYLIAQGLPRR